MPSHNEQVKPASFDVAPSSDVPISGAPESGVEKPRSWTIPALLGLGVIAALVVFWLPGRVAPVSQPEAGIESPKAAASKPVQQTPKTAPEEATPWSDAQMAKLRKDAQDKLGSLLDLQTLLEDTGVELWASEEFAQAKTFAVSGDAQYREREFEQASANYEQGLGAMQAILERTDDALAQQILAATSAIENGDQLSARQHLEVVTAIEPGHSELAKLSRRADTLEQLLPLLQSAEEAELAGDLATAERQLREATAVDPDHRRTRSELERIKMAHIALQFGDAMSDGYAALDENRFVDARKAFSNAANLQPGSSEAASALQEVEVAQTAYRLSALQQRGTSAEQQEKWQEAVTAYQQALDIDGNILYAQEGLKRSSTRAKLDKQFTNAIEEPNRLSDVAVAEATATLLKGAKKIASPGPVLSRQIDTLDGLLKTANSPLALTLQSDGQTEVIVYKVARLGVFDQKMLTLRPGKYTAVGTRNGYRDVRITFDLNHEDPLSTVVIRCTEQI